MTTLDLLHYNIESDSIASQYFIAYFSINNIESIDYKLVVNYIKSHSDMYGKYHSIVKNYKSGFAISFKHLEKNV